MWIWCPLASCPRSTLAGLAGRSPRPPAAPAPVRPGRHPTTVAGGPPGRGRRRAAGRAVIPERRRDGRELARPRSATARTCRWAPWPPSAFASPTAPSSPPWPTCARCCWRWQAPARWSWCTTGCSVSRIFSADLKSSPAWMAGTNSTPSSSPRTTSSRVTVHCPTVAASNASAGRSSRR
jgi:hypothetical protein